MERDPAQRISRAISSLDPTQREALAQALEAVIRNLLIAPLESVDAEARGSSDPVRAQESA
jgi:hypothetical protein